MFSYIQQHLRLFVTRIVRKCSSPYSIITFTMAITVVFLLIYFALTEYKANHNNILTKLETDSARIERALDDVFSNTAFLMKIMIMQIKGKHRDLNHVNNVLNKYSSTHQLQNSMSLCAFAWLNKENIKVVDSISGTDITPTNFSNREYAKVSRLIPEKLYLFAPTFGFINQRYTIPAIMGASHNGEYIGALTVGFDLVNLSTILSSAMHDQDIYFALLDQNLEIIMQSPHQLSPHSHKHTTAQELQDFIDKTQITFDSLKSVSEIELLFSGDNHYLYKLPRYPFVIYLHYNNKTVTNSFWQAITYRVIEVVCIALIASIILTIIYRREKKLRANAEYAKLLAIRASNAKTEFLAYTAHELRSPLGFIISSSEVMLSKPFGRIEDQYLSYIQNINQSSQELLEFVDDLIDSMKLEYVDFAVEEKVTNISSLVKRSIKASNAIYNNKINIETYFPNDLPKLYTDPKRLLQIFNNLISNSIKYSEPQTTLTISVRLQSKSIHIIFADQGRGMSEQEIEAVMTKWKTEQQTINQKLQFKSVGLGLQLVKHLLSLMNGHIIINSEIDKGTTITLSFPKNMLVYSETKSQGHHVGT